MRAGYAQAAVCVSRMLELPRNVDMGAPRSPQGNGANGLQCDNFVALCGVSLWRSKTKKFPFHFFFRFAVEGWGEETREKCKEIFWFLHTRVRERVRGALYRITTQSGRTERFRATTRSARAISQQSDCFGKTFGFCSGDTAKFQNSFFRQNAERRKATRRGFQPEFAKGF